MPGLTGRLLSVSSLAIDCIWNKFTLVGLVFRLRHTHFNSNYFNRLIPTAQGTTNRTTKNALNRIKLVGLWFSAHCSYWGLGKTSKTHTLHGTVRAKTFSATHLPAPPIGALPKSHSIDTFINTRNAFATVYIHERSPGALCLESSFGLFMTGDFRCLHTCAKSWQVRTP